jgi:hypothetical protein
VAGGLDHIVGAPDEPEIAVGVALGDVAGQVPAAGDTCDSAFFMSDNRGTWTASRPQRQLALDIGFCHDVNRAILCGSLPLIPGSGLPMEPGRMASTDNLRSDPAGLRLPPVVMDRQTERFLAPTASGLSGSPTLR